MQQRQSCKSWWINSLFSRSSDWLTLFCLQRQKGKRIDEEVVNLPPDLFGRPKAPAGTWGSCIRIIDPIESKTVSVINLEGNEAAFSLAIVPFAAKGGELHLVVGTAADTHIAPRSCSSGYLRTYKFTDDGAGLEFQHKVRFIMKIFQSVWKLTNIYRPKSMMFL